MATPQPCGPRRRPNWQMEPRSAAAGRVETSGVWVPIQAAGRACATGAAAVSRAILVPLGPSLSGAFVRFGIPSSPSPTAASCAAGLLERGRYLSRAANRCQVGLDGSPRFRGVCRRDLWVGSGGRCGDVECFCIPAVFRAWGRETQRSDLRRVVYALGGPRCRHQPAKRPPSARHARRDAATGRREKRRGRPNASVCSTR